jgi:hypothetical protein
MDQPYDAAKAATSSSTAAAIAGGSAQRVTENDLHRLQEELNRATAKEATCTGTAIRREGEHHEAQQALKVAKRNVEDLRARLSESTRRWHAQRAQELGISDPDYLPGSGKITPAESATAQVQADQVLAGGRPRIPVGTTVILNSGGPPMEVVEVIGDQRRCTWDGCEFPDMGELFHVDALKAIGGRVTSGGLHVVGERAGEAIVPAARRRTFDDLTAEEQDGVILISQTTNPRWKLPDGELIDSNNPDIVV